VPWWAAPAVSVAAAGAFARSLHGGNGRFPPCAPLPDRASHPRCRGGPRPPCRSRRRGRSPARFTGGTAGSPPCAPSLTAPRTRVAAVCRARRVGRGVL